MTEKIEWYKEVLELEPNSKVFFPLARLLVEEGYPEEAVAVLEQGLARHDEFLEARLFLIELLYKTGQQTSCEAQVEKLSRMFTAYSGFWQAWAATTLTSGQSPDTAAVMRFLALNFAKGPVSLREVLDQGITSLLGHDAPAAGSDARHPTIDETKKLQVSHEDSMRTDASGHEASLSSESVALPSPSGQQDIPAQQHRPLAQSQDDTYIDAAGTDEDAFSAVRQAHEHLSHEDPGTDPVVADHLVHEKLDTFDPDEGEDGASLEAPLHSITARSFSDDAADAPSRSPYDEAPSGENATDGTAHAGEEADDSEERFSLRTRSMAEVLAEQGDIKGALDIYHELAAVATAPEESADLRQRIATLNARLGSAPPVEQTQEPAETGGSTGKDKLISMLEALAERVEARAHS